MSRLKSRSSSKSAREMVIRVQAEFAIASVERSERSNTAISPKHAPGVRTTSASSPDPGMVREIRTSPSEMMNSRLPGSPSLNTYSPAVNLCSRHTSATRASSPASRSWKIAACFNRLRSTAQATPRGREGQVKPRVTWADLLTALRVPLAIAFPFVRHPAWQLAIVGAAAASDFFDGLLARRLGPSRAGALLDPVADKLFVASAFLTVAGRGRLHPIEILGVLARDIVAGLGWLGTLVLRRPVALPARAGGKAVTVLQLLTLVAFIAESSFVRPLAL